MKHRPPFRPCALLLPLLLLLPPAAGAQDSPFPFGAASHRQEHLQPDGPKLLPERGDPGRFGFTVPLGRGRVEGELRLPPGEGVPRVALLLPDFGPWDRDGGTPLGPGDTRPVFLDRLLREAGIATARYDKRGTACSSGEMNLPFSRHEQDAIAVYKFLRTLDIVRSDGVILIGLGSGCLTVAKIAASEQAPQRAIELHPPLPDFAAAFARGKAAPEAHAALLVVRNTPRDRCIPFSGRSADPLTIYLSTNPAESKELLERGDLRARETPRCPTLVLLDLPQELPAAGSLEVRVVDPADGAAVRRAILGFLGEAGK